jgi:rsbT co-antagonist protein RsbR
LLLAMAVEESVLRAKLLDVLQRREGDVVDRWVALQRNQAALPASETDDDLRAEGRELVSCLRDGLAGDIPVNRIVSRFEPLRSSLQELSWRRARQGSSPTATALGVLGLKSACMATIREEAAAGDDADLLEMVIAFGNLIDAAGLLTFETYVQGREDIIRRQNQQLLELSTPVVRLWDRVLAVPLIGTLDSARTQVVTENLLQAIQDHEAVVAIIDITGVPTVDTLVAQHLLQTVAATRLMGADCIISGIRPQTAQTIAQLGIDLADIITRASLADALATAIGLVPDGTGPGGRRATASSNGLPHSP